MFSAAMNAANRFDHPDSDMDSRDDKADPRRTGLDNTVRKLDVMDLLLFRRKLHADAAHDMIVAINLYSDSSPVSGSEIQGMLMDIHRRNDDNERIELPGGNLSYGQFDAVSKSMCLLHALWLVAGPDAQTIRYCLRKVASITTDHGTEMHTLEMRDVVDAYCAYMQGASLEHCRTLVDVTSRWLPNALRISGWSHSMGNIMRHTAEATTRWPRILQQMRDLVGFFRNATWRQYIQKALEAHPPDDFDLHLLDHFRAQIAKWRYETIPATMQALLPLRVLCEKHIQAEWFANAQDKEFLKSVMDACKDAFLWHFMEASYREVFAPAERDRRFGMICNCEEHLRERREDHKKHIACWRNGRRLDEAFEYIRRRANERLARSRTITCEECGNDGEVWRTVTLLLKSLHAKQTQRFKYLDSPPWSAVRCGDIDGAKRFLKQVSKHPLEHHDPVTRKIMEEYGDDIRVRANGGEVSPKLQTYLEWMKTISLDESCGEGWRRGANYEKKLAYASTCASLKRAVRRKNVFLRLRKFRRTYGKRAEEVLRFEFRHWKRILSIQRSKWKSRKMDDKKAFEAIYREGKPTEVNWSTVVSRMGLHHVNTESATTTEGVQNEYLRAIVAVGNAYGVQAEQSQAAGSHAAPQPQEESHVHFRVLDIAHGHSRAHTMPTVDDAEDVSKVAAIAWQVQFQQLRTRGDDESALPEHVVEVFDDGEPQWIRPRTVASFECIQQQLMEYRRVEPSPLQGCVWLSDSHHALPKQALTDKDCPVLTLVQHLKRRGWLPAERQVVHHDATVGVFDCVEATRYRGYFQCLVSLPTVMNLTRELPSRAPMAYYNLLRHGIRAQPYQSAKDYQAIVNRELRKKGKRAEVIPIEDGPVEPAPVEDRIRVALADVPAGERPQKRSSAHVPGMGGAGRGKKRPAPGASSGSGGPGPSEPLPIVGPPSGGAGGAPPPQPLPPGAPAEEPDEDAIRVGAGAPAPKAKQRRTLGRDWKDGVGDAKICYKEYSTPAGKLYRNYIIKCTQGHPSCHKTVGRTANNMKTHGELEPLAIAHAWLDMDVPDGEKHSLQDPGPALVDSFLAHHEEELDELLHTLVHSL